MKIVEMRVTPVAMADPPLFSSYGLHAPYALRTIIELVSEDGITGMAESHGGERVLAQFEQASPAVIGRNAYDLGRLSIDLDALYAVPASPSTPTGIATTQTFILPGENSQDTARSCCPRPDRQGNWRAGVRPARGPRAGRGSVQRLPLLQARGWWWRRCGRARGCMG
jgi:hypothetical protein